MTPDAPPPHVAGPVRRGARVRKRRRRHGIPRVFQDLVLPVLLVGAVAAIFGVRYLSRLATPEKLPGYIVSSQTLTQEYFQFEGRSLRDLGIQQQFEQATALAGRGDYKGAIHLLEGISKDCAVPVIFQNLGVLYAHMNDHRRALDAFREALARDPNYPPVHLSLSTLPGFTVHEADPVTAEVEPNDTSANANLISLEVPVMAEISSPSDVDYFRFSAPRAPRDVLRIEITNQSPALELHLSVSDEAGHPTGENAESSDAGAGLTLLISPKPNSTRYLQVMGKHGFTGRYSLRVSPTRAFDRYEPNDDIASAFTIQTGQMIQANIMTAEDVDFYSFTTEEAGNLTITLVSQSETLLPALAIFGPDAQPIGFAVDATEQGQRITRSLDVAEKTVYYIQVWGRAGSAGSYALIVK